MHVKMTVPNTLYSQVAWTEVRAQSINGSWISDLSMLLTELGKQKILKLYGFVYSLIDTPAYLFS